MEFFDGLSSHLVLLALSSFHLPLVLDSSPITPQQRVARLRHSPNSFSCDCGAFLSDDLGGFRSPLITDDNISGLAALLMFVLPKAVRTLRSPVIRITADMAKSISLLMRILLEVGRM